MKSTPWALRRRKSLSTTQFAIPDAYKKTTLVQNKHYIEKNIPEEVTAIIIEEGNIENVGKYYKLHYREDNKFKSTKMIPATSNEMDNMILTYQEQNSKEYFEYVLKEHEKYDDYPSVLEWIYNGGRLEELILWAWEEGIIE